MVEILDRLLLAGERPSRSAVATCLTGLHLRLLSNLQSIVDLDPKIPDGAFKFRVAKQELDRPEIFRPLPAHSDSAPADAAN